MASEELRLTFAQFLDRLAADHASVEEWQTLAVAHYDDPVLESVRRRCVRLAIDASFWGEWSTFQREGFRSLAAELRGQAIVRTRADMRRSIS